MFETIVLDVDGGVAQQRGLLTRYGATVLPLQERTSALRFWCSRGEMEELRAEVVSALSSRLPKAIFYGSGDYHHLAYVGLSLIEEPVTVMHFDNHSDYWREEFVNRLAFLGRVRGTDYFNYGSWVIPALRLPYVEKVLQFGVDGDFRLGNYLPIPKGMSTHAFDLLLQGRIETYPNRMRRSLLFGRLEGCSACVAFEPGFLTTMASWRNMGDHGGVREAVSRAVSRIETEAVYVTIDKDVLDERESFSAYPGFSGKMRLEELLAALAIIAKRKRVVGLDVCGDASSHRAIAAARDGAKRVMARRQYGRIAPERFASPANIGMNEKVNTRIMAQFD